MGLQRLKDSCQIFPEILQTVFSLQHSPCKRPVCIKVPKHAPYRFWLWSVLFLIDFGSSVTQARVSNTVRATDPCALIFSNTVRVDQSRSVPIQTHFGSSTSQTRISNTVRATDPCALIFLAHGPCLSSYGPCHCFHAHILCIYEPVPLLDEFDL